MSFIDGNMHMFPDKFIRECIETYTKNHKQSPKYLVASEEEYLDWCLINFCGKGVMGQDPPTFMGVTIIIGEYLKVGEYDLALDIKKPSGE